MQTTGVQTEVLIVGAGPSGLSMAAQLLRYNINFIIIDDKEGVTELSKAMVVHARTLEIYDQLGLAQTAIAAGGMAQKANLMHDGKVYAHLEFGNFGEHLSPFPFALGLEQSKTEGLLYEYLQQHDQEVRWQTELQRLTQDENGVSATVKTSDGETQTITAQYLVGCDGAGSPTRHLLGLGFEGSTNPRLFYVADVEMEFPADRTSLNAIFGADAFALAFPMQGECHWRLIGNLPEYNDDLDREVGFEEVAAKFKQLAQLPLEITQLLWFSTYKVHTRHAEAFSQGRCFLAGDAAHIHTPAGGQGMNTGIQDAYNLAWKLAFVLRGWAGTVLLASYDQERLANAKRLLATTDVAFDFMAGDHWYTQFFRNNIVPTLASILNKFQAAKELVFPIISQITINYRESSLSQPAGNREFRVKAGDRMPYFLVNGASLYDLLREPKFHLLVFSDVQDSYENLKSELNAEYGALVDFNIIPLYPRVIKLFGTDQPFQVLLRPDNYISYLSNKISVADVKSYFRQVIKHV